LLVADLYPFHKGEVCKIYLFVSSYHNSDATLFAQLSLNANSNFDGVCFLLGVKSFDVTKTAYDLGLNFRR